MNINNTYNEKSSSPIRLIVYKDSIVNGGNNEYTLDVSNSFELILNKESLKINQDKSLKTVGGTTVSSIEVLRSKSNDRFFGFYNHNQSSNALSDISIPYKSKILVNGVEVMNGEFKIDSINSKRFLCSFVSNDFEWLSLLKGNTLNRIGYVNDKPTWLVEYNGHETFDIVNGLTIKDSDYCLPLIRYNNTPLTGYRDAETLHSFGINGELVFGQIDSNGNRLTEPYNLLNDAPCLNDYFGFTLGLTHDSMPPAVYYKTILERIFKDIDMKIYGSIFNEDWFNKLIIPFGGTTELYKYNYKNIAQLVRHTLFTNKQDEDSFNNDTEIEIDTYNTTLDLNINKQVLPNLGGGSGTTNWIGNESFRFSKSHILGLKRDNNLPNKDLISNCNKFGVRNQYVCPADGSYTINITTNQYSRELTDSNDVYDGNVIYIGNSVLNSFGSWETNGNNPQDIAIERTYSWDDNILVVERLNEGGKQSFGRTHKDLYRYMNGQSDDFIKKPNDIIAYFSPKRQVWRDNNTNPLISITDDEIKGSPITSNQSQVYVQNYSHSATETAGSRLSQSSASIEVTLDLRRNERVLIYWCSLININGEVLLSPSSPQPYIDCYDKLNTEIDYQDNHVNITYNCGEHDLDLAQNLPSNITCVDFIKSLCNQFNLYPVQLNNTLTFYTQNEYFNSSYSSLSTPDITDFVHKDSFEITNNKSPKQWNIGYSNDEDDKYVGKDNSDNSVDYCKSVTLNTTTNYIDSDYANISIINEYRTTDEIINNLSLFSSTKFIDCRLAVFNSTDLVYPLFVKDIRPLSPTFGSGVWTGLDLYYGGSNTVKSPNKTKMLQMKIPSIQSKVKSDIVKLKDLDYSFNYKLRVMYFHGFEQSKPYDQYLTVGLPEDKWFNHNGGLDNYKFKPTVCSFDYELNFEQHLNITDSFKTLRYDSNISQQRMSNGNYSSLYSRYFNSLISDFSSISELSLNLSMSERLWSLLNSNTQCKYNDKIYKIKSIKGYKPSANSISSKCKITLIK